MAVADNGGLPEFRRNPITGDWVLYAAGRAARPNDFRQAAESGPCPFCPGNERLTPPEILAGRPNESSRDAPGWRWRVVPNKYPALEMDAGDVSARAESGDWRAGTGRHEVLIETARHDAGLADLTRAELTAALLACRTRIAVLHREPGISYVLVLKNQGQGSGASLRHPHFQIAALPVVPERIKSQLDRAREYFEHSGACAHCDLTEKECAQGTRLIHSDDDLTVFAPSGTRFPGEAWILPRQHAARFEESSDRSLAAVAAATGRLASALRSWAGDVPFNLALHTAPPGAGRASFCHWRIELMPRLTGVAGFEWATGIHVNQIPPEEAAGMLRAHWS